VMEKKLSLPRIRPQKKKNVVGGSFSRRRPKKKARRFLKEMGKKTVTFRGRGGKRLLRPGGIFRPLSLQGGSQTTQTEGKGREALRKEALSHEPARQEKWFPTSNFLPKKRSGGYDDMIGKKREGPCLPGARFQRLAACWGRGKGLEGRGEGGTWCVDEAEGRAAETKGGFSGEGTCPDRTGLETFIRAGGGGFLDLYKELWEGEKKIIPFSDFDKKGSKTNGGKEKPERTTL